MFTNTNKTVLILLYWSLFFINFKTNYTVQLFWTLVIRKLSDSNIRLETYDLALVIVKLRYKIISRTGT